MSQIAMSPGRQDQREHQAGAAEAEPGEPVAGHRGYHRGGRGGHRRDQQAVQRGVQDAAADEPAVVAEPQVVYVRGRRGAGHQGVREQGPEHGPGQREQELHDGYRNSAAATLVFASVWAVALSDPIPGRLMVGQRPLEP